MRSRGTPTYSTPAESMQHQLSNAQQAVYNGSAPGHNGASSHAQRAPRPHPTPRQPDKVTASEPFEGWLPLLFLAIALYSVVGSIIAAQWVEKSTLLLWMPLAGLLVGLAIAKIPRFPQSILHLTACLVGHWLAVWLTSSFAFGVSWQQVMTYLRMAFEGQMAEIANEQASEIIFFFYLAFLCFFLGYFGSWLIYRARLPWLVAMVYSSIMLVNLNYIAEINMIPLLLIMVGALLLLIARMNLFTRILQWKQEGLYTDRPWLHKLSWRSMQITSILLVTTLLLGSSLPIFAQPVSGQQFWMRADTAWNNLLNGQFSWKDFNNLSPFAPSNQNFFGDQLTITSNVDLPDGEVLTYQSSGNASSQPSYLAGFTYNNFDGQTWNSTITTNESYEAGEILPTDNPDGATRTATITLIQPPRGTLNYIFAPEQPHRFSLPVTVYMDSAMDTSPAAWTIAQSLQANAQYQVEYIRPVSDAEKLQLLPLPADDPNIWISNPYLQEHYLQLPDNLDPIIQETMQEWTASASNAYAALKMLEARLSNTKEFRYSLENPPVPADMGVVDWLLQNKQGYCTHYATAMTVMGRMLGIPMRMVNGFSQGYFDEARDAWIVEGRDAHNWVQAYFPWSGWVSFDPTPGFAENATPTEESVAAQQTPTPTPAEPTATTVPTQQATATPDQANPDPTNPSSNDRNTNDATPLLMGLSIGAIVLSLLFCVIAVVRYWWHSLYANSSFVAGVYWRFCKLASMVGMAPKSWQTPYEYSNKLGQQFPSQASSLSHLTDLFVRERWGSPRHRPHDQELSAVQQHWRTLRSLFWRLLVQRLKRKSS